MLAGSFNLSGDRRGAAAACGSWSRRFVGLRRLPRRRPRRDAPPALRPARGRERTGRRLPHRVLGHEVRHVLRRRVPRHHADLRHDRDAVLRRLARARACRRIVWFLLKTVALHHAVHPAAGHAAAPALRPADGLRLEGDAAAGAAESAGDGRPCCWRRSKADKVRVYESFSARYARSGTSSCTRFTGGRPSSIPSRSPTCRRAGAGGSSSRATPTAGSAAWPATCARWPARWTASPCRPRRTSTAGATRSSSASTSRAASSAASARRPARPTPSSSRRISRWASTSAQNLVYEKEDLLISGTGQVPRLQFLPRGRAGHRRQGQGRGRERDAAGGRAQPAALSDERADDAYCFYISAARRRRSPRSWRSPSRMAVHALLYLVVSLLAGGGRSSSRWARPSWRRWR